MNIKTTIGLCILVIVVAGAYLVWAWMRAPEAPTENENLNATAAASTPAAPPVATEPAAEEEISPALLTQPPLTDESTIVKVGYFPRDQEPMLFERVDEDQTAARAQWQMVAPTRCPATTFMVNNIITTVKRMKSVTQHHLGAPGSPSLEEAGFLPGPKTRLSVSTDEETSVSVEVGNTLTGDQHVYVRVPSKSEDIIYVVGSGDIDNVLDREAVAFREKKIFNLKPADAVEVQVTARTDAGTTTYELLKQDDEWLFVKPFKGKANREKIDEVVRSLSTLRAREWLLDIPQDLAEFGLDQAHLQIKLVTEHLEEAPAADSAPEADAPVPETIRRQFAVLLSDRRPLDDREQVYMKRLEEEQVGTINSSQADVFVPVVTEWRDMDVLDASVLDADAIALTIGEEAVALRHGEEAWTFAESERGADASVVQDLLVALDGLEAVNFVPVSDSAAMGLAEPMAQVTLTFDDTASSETLIIGDYTEAVEKRLRYVQRVGSTAAAKVKAKDVALLFHEPSYYYDRAILNYDPGRINKLMVDRSLPGSGWKQFVTLERDANRVWQMTTPTQMDVDLKAVNGLVNTLANMRGTRVVEEPNPANLGLHMPEVSITLTVEGVPVVKVPEAGADSAQQLQAQASEPIIEQLQFAVHEDAVYARNLAKPVFFEIAQADFEALMTDFADPRIWSFEPSQVVAFSTTSGGREVGFTKVRDTWQYSVEPDIPIDPKKIDLYLSQMRELQTQRHVAYNISNLDQFGLGSPAYRFFIQLADDSVRELLVSERLYDGDGPEQHYAMVVGANSVFLLPMANVQRNVIELERFEPDE